MWPLRNYICGLHYISIGQCCSGYIQYLPVYFWSALKSVQIAYSPHSLLPSKVLFLLLFHISVDSSIYAPKARNFGVFLESSSHVSQIHQLKNPFVSTFFISQVYVLLSITTITTLVGLFFYGFLIFVTFRFLLLKDVKNRIQPYYSTIMFSFF